jgi:3-hydroxyisobutyrate dehydrogenase-like beta-hydroxyacid dehydrogenase
MMKRIASLGLGAMGSRMAMHLHDAGYELTVWNRSEDKTRPFREKGISSAASPAEAVQGADLAIAIVSDDQASEEVWLAPSTGAVHGLSAGTIVVESSTLTPEWVRELAPKIGDKGALFLDAPVSGSTPQAENRELVFLAGGEEAIVERFRPVAEVMGKAMHHMGEVGMGATMKLVVNFLLGAQVASMAEALGLAEKAGLDFHKTAGTLQDMPLTSPILKLMTGLMAAEDYQPRFTVDLVEKDFRYILETAGKAGASVPIAGIVRERFLELLEAGHESENITSIAKLYRS